MRALLCLPPASFAEGKMGGLRMKLIPAGGAGRGCCCRKHPLLPPLHPPWMKPPSRGTFPVWKLPHPHIFALMRERQRFWGRAAPQPGFLQHLPPRATRDLGSSLLQGITGPEMRALPCFLEQRSQPLRGLLNPEVPPAAQRVPVLLGVPVWLGSEGTRGVQSPPRCGNAACWLLSAR